MSPTVESRALLDKGSENSRAAALLRREGFLDIAASRAYYAMFYAAEALLLARAGGLLPAIHYRKPLVVTICRKWPVIDC